MLLPKSPAGLASSKGMLKLLPSQRKFRLYSPAWLSADERFSLTVWRAGAVRTKTRLNDRPNQHNMHTECDWCDAPAASAHHYFTACPRFERIRQELQTEFGIPPQWWSQQPRCLTKAGWITMSAAHTRPRRVKLQIAACKLGVEICKACAPDTPASPQML